jgi:hypothetical protein
LAPSNTTISATISTTTSPISNSATLTVNAAVATSVTITPATPQLIAGYMQQLQATAVYSDQTTADVTASVAWSSSDTSVITMNPSGLSSSGQANPLLAGNAVITATLGETSSGSTNVTVVEAALTSIAITPLSPSMAAGTSQQLSAVGTFSNGSTMDLNRFVDWQSADVTVASFNPNFQSSSGFLSALIVGNTDISASSDGVQSTTTVTVTAATLTSVALSPAIPQMSSGQTLQMRLIGTYSDNSVADLTSSAVWSSTNTNIATFNPNLQPDSGLVSAIAAGNSTLQAEFTTLDMQAFSGSTTLVVTGGMTVNPQAPAMATLDEFVMIASLGIATTAGSNISDGDLAVLDANRPAFTGFSDGVNAGEFTQLTNGLSYAPDDVNPPYLVPAPYASTAAYLSQVKTDLMAVAAYLAADSNPGAVVSHLNTDALNTAILTKGVYHLDGDVAIIDGNLTLDGKGDADSVFIFNVSGNFITAATGGNIVLVNNAKASNVYWRIGGSTTIGTSSQFAGNVVSTQSIQLQTGATVQGRLISVAGNIQLDANSVTKPL